MQGHGEAHLHEGAWIYLSLRGHRDQIDSELHRGVVEACEASGWPAVSWSALPRKADGVWGLEHFDEGISHAVEHADVVIVLLNDTSGVADRELDYAFRHRRPVIGLRLESAGEPAAEAEARIRSYERSRLLACSDTAGCVAELRRALSDPEFAVTVREAASELSSRV